MPGCDGPGRALSGTHTRGTLLAIVLATLAFATRGGVPAAHADVIGKDEHFGRKIETGTSRIDHFEIGSDRTRFGDLEFIGGLVVASDDPALGGMSSVRLGSDRRAFLGIEDTGFWYSGEFSRDDEGRLSGLSDFRVAPIRGRDGRPIPTKWRSDAESVAVRRNDIVVGFEREHRVDAYPLMDPQASGPLRTLPLPFPVAELRRNRGLETVAVSPEDGPLAGATVAVSELSINKAGDIYAGILDGPRRGTFFVKRQPPYAISDGDFLPDGDLLLLERGVTLASAFSVRIERIAGKDIKPGATVSGKVIFSAGLGDQIDNMEGLSVTRAADGGVYLLLVSDDNNSILQRSLFLEFRLAERAPGQVH